jgi:hypothetical protein
MILKPTIKYGYVTVKYDSWHGVDLLGGNEKTDRWKSSSNEGERRLRLSSIDGKVTSLNHAKFLEQFQHTQRVVELD